jgi:hypothetical protein
VTAIAKLDGTELGRMPSRVHPGDSRSHWPVKPRRLIQAHGP